MCVFGKNVYISVKCKLQRQVILAIFSKMHTIILHILQECNLEMLENTTKSAVFVHV